MRHDDYARQLLSARSGQGLAREGALAGVPFLLKDLNTYLAGTSTSNGSRFFKDAGQPSTPAPWPPATRLPAR